MRDRLTKLIDDISRIEWLWNKIQWLLDHPGTVSSVLTAMYAVAGFAFDLPWHIVVLLVPVFGAATFGLLYLYELWRITRQERERIQRQPEYAEMSPKDFGDKCVRTAQRIYDFLEDKEQDRPERPVELDGDAALEHHNRKMSYGRSVAAEYKRRFADPAEALIAELHEMNCLDDSDVWHLSHISGIRDVRAIADALAREGRRLAGNY